MAKLFLLHGFVGAGKTTFAKKLSAETGAIRFSPDEWMDLLYGNNPPEALFADYNRRVKDLIWNVAEQLLKRDQHVILDYGFWTRKSRNEYRLRGSALNVETVLYSVSCDPQLMRERVRQRSLELPKGALFIDDNAMDLFLTKFEPLQEDEEHLLIKTDLEDAQAL